MKVWRYEAVRAGVAVYARVYSKCRLGGRWWVERWVLESWPMIFNGGFVVGKYK